MKLRTWYQKTVLMCVVLGTTFIVSLFLESHLNMDNLIPTLFTLAVFIIALLTDGYIYGIIASLLCVLALNFAFTFPFFQFNFSIPENMISALILLIITISTSTLTTKIRVQEKMKAETEKEKIRANLLRAVSHDLRTPLTTIFGSSSTILEQFHDLSKEQIITLARSIQEDSQWLMTMVENLLTITRIDNKSLAITKQSVVLEELIDMVLVKMRKRYPNQKIELSIPAEFISIPMDVVLIEQVLFNLLENAILHAKGMTKLALTVHVEGEKAVFMVIDNGCGLSKEKLKNIFQGTLETNSLPIDSQKKSMGIGLSVCAAIIKAHEGSINVINNESGGCCFSFTLDMEDDQDGNEIEDFDY